MQRRDIQARRKRSDAEILHLLGRPFEPQYAGLPYAEASRALAAALQLYDITTPSAPNRILIVGRDTEQESIAKLAERLAIYSLAYDVRTLLLMPPDRPMERLPTYHPMRRIAATVRQQGYLRGIHI